MSTHFDGSLKFDTKIVTTGITTGLKKISELAKSGEQALAKLTLDGLKKSGEKTLAVLSKVALNSLNTSIVTAKDGLIALTKGMGNLVKGAVEVGESFESAMSQVMATAGMTKDTMSEVNGQSVNAYDTLSNKAKELGANTQFTASQVAESFNYMALAGWKTEEQLNGIEGILNLAAASGMDLANTCDLVTDYLTAFGMKSEEAGTMADMMAYAQSNSNTTVQDLADAYGNCAANMNANGQSIATTTALLSKLADNGLKGSMAGTALSASMRDIVNSMEDGQITIGDTSIAVADSEGNFRNYIDILADIEKATDGMGTAQKTSALSMVFTSYSIKAMNMLMQTGADSVEKFSEKLTDCDGYAAQTAKTLNDNLAGDMKSLSSAAEGVQIAMSERLNPSLRELAQNGTKYLKEFNSALNTDGSQGLMNFASSIGNVLVEALEDNEKALQNATAIGSDFMNALIDGIRNNQDKIAQSFTKSILQGVSVGEKVFTNFYDLGLQLVSSVGDGLAENPKMFKSLTEDFLTNISSSFSQYSSKLVQSGTTILKAILQGVSKSSKNVSKDITTLIGDIAKILADEFPEFITVGTDIVTGLITGITEGMAQSDVTAKDIIDSIATGLSKNGDRLLDSAWTLVSALGKGIGENLPQLAQYGLDIVLALTGFIGEHANEIGDGALDLILALADTLITEDNLTRIGSSAIKLISNFVSGLTSEENMLKLSQVANNIVKAVTGALFGNSNGGSGINDVLSAGANIGGQLLSGLTTALFNENGGIFKILDTLVTSIGEYLSENFWNLGTMVMEGFMSGVTGIDFSFEGFGEYMYDSTHSGNYWQDYFTNLGTALNADNVSNNEVEAYFNRGQGSMTYDEYLQSLENAVSESNKSNSDTAKVYQETSTQTNNSIKLLSDNISKMLDRKVTIQTYLYPNSSVYAESIVEGMNVANSTSGGHLNG